MQLVAMITMLIDHIGLVFFPESEAWRIVGRIAFPLYAYGIVQGFQYTSNRQRYIQRLLWLSAASQIPFMVSLQLMEINVIGTFALCLAVLSILDRFKSRFISIITVISALVLLQWLPFDYGSYALLLILIYRYKSSRAVWTGYHFLLNLVFWFWKGWLIQVFSILPTFFVGGRMKLMQRPVVPRWMWRSFYPAHLSLLAIIIIVQRLGGF